jgi:hypothetical protein
MVHIIQDLKKYGSTGKISGSRVESIGAILKKILKHQSNKQRGSSGGRSCLEHAQRFYTAKDSETSSNEPKQ